MLRGAQSRTDPSSGELRLGCTEPMSSGFVPAIVDRLSRDYPKLIFHVTQADPATLQARGLQYREIELAIGRIPDGLPENELSVEVLFQEPVFLASGRTNPLTRRRKVELAELMDKFWSVPPNRMLSPMAQLFIETARELAAPLRTMV